MRTQLAGLRNALFAVGCAGVLSLGVSACGSSDDESPAASTASGSTAATTATTAAEPASVAYLGAGSTSYEQALVRASKATVEAAGGTVTNFSAEFDPQKQVGQCQTAIASGRYQGLLIYAVDQTALVPCVKEAQEAGVKVVSVDSAIGPDYESREIQVDGVDGQVYLSIEDDATATAALIRQACEGDDDCKVGLFVGDPAYTSLQKRVEKLRRTFADDPAIEVVTTLTTGLGQPDAGLRGAQNLLSAHPDIDVIAGDDDQTLSGANGFLEREGLLGTRVKTIGVGGQRGAVASIAAGKQFGTVISIPETDARAAATMLLDAIAGRPIEKPSVSFAELSPIGTIELTRANAGEFTAQWGE